MKAKCSLKRIELYRRHETTFLLKAFSILSFFPPQDLTALLRTMGQNPTDSEVNDMINEVDVDGSGVLDFDEFVTFVRRLMRNRGDPENELREAYRRY